MDKPQKMKIKKPFLSLFFLLFVVLQTNAQLETTTNKSKKSGSLGILSANTKELKKPTSIKIDATNGFKNAYKNRKKTKKELDKELKNKGIITQAQLNEERFLKSFKKINGQYIYPKIDQDLGSIRTQSKFVKIVCRDFGAIDGDRVRIYVNDTPVIHNIYLKQYYQSFIIYLETGLNKIDFMALNQGTSGPNTADFKVYNESGSLISSNEWNLATGAKATLLVAKDK